MMISHPTAANRIRLLLTHVALPLSQTELDALFLMLYMEEP
jgi:hypothetical protein